MTLTSNRLLDDYIGMVARPRLGLNIDSVKETCPTITIFNSVIISTISILRLYHIDVFAKKKTFFFFNCFNILKSLHLFNIFNMFMKDFFFSDIFDEHVSIANEIC